MTTLALLNQYFLLNSVDFSDHVRDLTLAANATQLSSEAMGDAWEETTTGLKAGTINFNVLDDFAAGSIDATVWAAFAAGTNVAWEVRPVNAVRSATNPGYSGLIHPSEYQLGGQLNTMAMKQLNWKISGAISRAVS